MININPGGRFMEFSFPSTIQFLYAELFPSSEILFYFNVKVDPMSWLLHHEEYKGVQDLAIGYNMKAKI